MTKYAVIALAAVLCACLLAPSMPEAASARRQAQAQNTGTNIRTDYFSIRIPKGWRMPKPVKNNPNKNISAVFTPDDDSLAVTLNIIHAPENAGLIAAETARNMDKTGFKTDEPKEIDGLWRISIYGKANGRAWFGSNGKICAVTIMFGSDFQKADELLAAIKSPTPDLFPRSAN